MWSKLSLKVQDNIVTIMCLAFVIALSAAISTAWVNYACVDDLRANIVAMDQELGELKYLKYEEYEAALTSQNEILDGLAHLSDLDSQELRKINSSAGLWRWGVNGELAVYRKVILKLSARVRALEATSASSLEPAMAQ